MVKTFPGQKKLILGSAIQLLINCGQENLYVKKKKHFERCLGYLAVFQNLKIFVYSKISRGTRNDVLPNPGRETSVQKFEKV